MPQVALHHLFRSPGHNYFGHHGMPAGEHEIEDCEEFELVAGRGIVGDRFFDFKPDYKGQITFFDQAVVEQVRIHADKPELPAAAFRRNVIVEGVDLSSLIGRQFRLNGVLFEGTQECSPCYWMDAACGKPGIENLLKGRGGLRCKILSDGKLHRATERLELEIL